MASFNQIKARVRQSTPEVSTEAAFDYIKMDRLGGLLTTDWHQRLVLAGRAYTLDLGVVGATSYTALAGGTAVDFDQPEIVVAIDTGWLIPMEIDIGIVVDDMDAYDDITQIGFIADRAATVAAGVTATVETAVNLLDGGDAFGGRCYSICTGSCGSPTSNDYLGGKYWELTQVITETGGVHSPHEKSFYKRFPIPTLLAGPCAILGYVTGTNAPTFMGSVKFAYIPATWA